jgi:hypothetical protein
MKKYVIPITELIRSEMDGYICKDSGERYSNWGGTDPNDPYSNTDWNNQGYDNGDQEIEDDDGTIDASAKSWGDLWF